VLNAGGYIKALMLLAGSEETGEPVAARHRTRIILAEDGKPGRRPDGCGPNISMGTLAVVGPHIDPKDLLQLPAPPLRKAAGCGTVAQR
jgi:hypothetical protein